MNKVTWKRKNTKITSVAASVFCNENSEEEEEESDKEPSTSSNKKTKLEGRTTQSKRLIQEAVQLAEATRYFL